MHIHSNLILHGIFHDLIKRHKRVISSNSIFLQVTQVNVRGNEDLESVLIIAIKRALYDIKDKCTPIMSLH